MLRDFLIQNTTNERLEVLMEAVETVGAFNLVDILPEINGCLNIDENDDTFLVMNAINGVIIRYLNFIINDHQIELHSGYENIDILTRIAKILYTTTTEYDPQWVLENVPCEVTLDFNAKNNLAALARLLEDVHEMDFMECVKTVPDSLIELIKDHLDVQVVVVPTTTNPAILERYKTFLDGRRRGVINEVVNQTQVVGDKDLNSLIGIALDLIEQLPLKDQAFELVSMVLISNLPDEEIQNGINKVMWLLTSNQMEEDSLAHEIKKEYPSWTY